MTTRTAKSTADKAADATNDAAEKARDATNTAAERARDATSNAAERARDVTNAAAERARDLTSDAAREANARAETFVADTQRTVTEQFDKLSKNLEGLTAFGQDNIDALVKSSEIAAKAAEGIGSELSAYSKKAFEDGVTAAQEFAAAKTVTELFEKQTAYAQTAFEGFVSQATKMNEIYVAAAKDITAPLGARVSAATEAMRSFSA
jgi:phasin family protein